MKLSVSPITDHTLYVFKTNKRQNPFSELIDIFLKRQLILISHFSIVMSTPLLKDLNFFGYFQLLRDKTNHKLVTYKDRFIVNKKNKASRASYFRNYLAMSLIAQSFENWEALTKDIYRKQLEISISDKAVLKIALQNIPRRHTDLLRSLMTLFPNTNVFMNQNSLDHIRVIEHIRHAVVHTDQLVTEKFFQEHNAKFYSNAFSFKKSGLKYRPTVSLTDGTSIMKGFDSYGYNLFVCASTHNKFPVVTVKDKKANKK